ncbi:MAG: hypothetical protein M3O22_00360 [Pseudomonadota bacterium]|nr:hypothetical protein [Pseudomonadota bacterium]
MYLALLGAALLAGYAPYFYEGDMQWYVSLVSRDFIIFCVSLAGAIFIPYSRPAAKVIWSIWTLWQLAIFICKAIEAFTDFPVQFWDVVTTITALVFVLWMFSRRPHAPRQRPLADGHLYYILSAPSDFKSLLLSLFLRPYSGLRVYLDGKIWTYRRNHGFTRLEGEAALRKLKHCRMVHIGPATDEDRACLDSLIGTQWSLKTNCFALLENHFGPVRNHA